MFVKGNETGTAVYHRPIAVSVYQPAIPIKVVHVLIDGPTTHTNVETVLGIQLTRHEVYDGPTVKAGYPNPVPRVPTPEGIVAAGYQYGGSEETHRVVVWNNEWSSPEVLDPAEVGANWTRVAFPASWPADRMHRAIEEATAEHRERLKGEVA